MELDEGMELVRRNDPGITHITISDRIEVEEMHVVADAIAVNTKLTHLNLSGAQLTDTSIEILAYALKINTSIATLDLCNNSIGDDGARAISSAIRSNHNITRLGLGKNQIQEDGLAALADAIKKSSRQTPISIQLDWNNIDARGVRAFIPALVKTDSLSLHHNPIGDLGAAIIAKALRNNQTLKHIDLTTCEIGDAGIKELGLCLSTNRTLERIFISGNVFGDDGEMALVNGVVHNTVIQTISMDNVPAPIYDRLAENIRSAETAVHRLSVARRLAAQAQQDAIQAREMARRRLTSLRQHG